MLMALELSLKPTALDKLQDKEELDDE